MNENVVSYSNMLEIMTAIANAIQSGGGSGGSAGFVEHSFTDYTADNPPKVGDIVNIPSCIIRTQYTDYVRSNGVTTETSFNTSILDFIGLVCFVDGTTTKTVYCAGILLGDNSQAVGIRFTMTSAGIKTFVAQSFQRDYKCTNLSSVEITATYYNYSRNNSVTTLGSNCTYHRVE